MMIRVLTVLAVMLVALNAQGSKVEGLVVKESPYGAVETIDRLAQGIDLPMKALAWKDGEGQVWLGYNDPHYIADRHGIDDRDDVVKEMSNALDRLTEAAVSP